jgi:hypothetical protein
MFRNISLLHRSEIQNNSGVISASDAAKVYEDVFNKSEGKKT